MSHTSDVVVISHGPDHIAGLISYKTLHWESFSQICLIGKYTVPSDQYVPECWQHRDPHLTNPFVVVLSCYSTCLPDCMARWPLKGKYAFVESLLVQMSVVQWTACPNTDSIAIFTLLCTCALWARGQLSVKSEPEGVFCCGGMTKATLRNRK